VGSPLTDHADRGIGDDHAFWERLPFPGIPWTRALFVGVVCFALWFLLDAPSLQRSAQVSPLGVRRTVSMDVTGPVAALSRTLGLSNVVGWTDRAFGRTPGGGPALNVPIRPLKPRRVPVTTGPTTPTTLPPLNYHPTPADPLRVLIVGDSVGLDLGQPLVNALGAYGDVTTYLDGRVDTGLSRPDYFNWPAELHIDLANQQPQLVVVMIGANDPQGLVTPGGSIGYGQPGWDSAYSARVAAFIAEANAAGAHVLWVGMPPMQDPGLNAALIHLNGLVQAQVTAAGAGASYVSSDPSLANAQGGFTAYVSNGAGAVINIRTPDGIHLTPGGGAVLATAVVDYIQDDLHVELVPGTGRIERRD
jgi:lysophospholipase L1-like esterase